MTLHLFGTPLPPPLHAEAEAVIALLRSGAPRTEKVEAADDLIVRLVRVGIDYHFHDPARRFGLNLLLVKVIDVAAATTLRALKSATRRVLKGLSDAQLEEVAVELEERIYTVEVSE